MNSEHDDQVLFIQWLKAQGYWDRYGIFAIINGIPLIGTLKQRSKIINYMKAEGMRPGVSDLLFAIARGGYHGMFLELKRESGGILSNEQKEFIKIIEAAGYFSAIAAGLEEAVTITETYINWPETRFASHAQRDS